VVERLDVRLDAGKAHDVARPLDAPAAARWRARDLPRLRFRYPRSGSLRIAASELGFSSRDLARDAQAVDCASIPAAGRPTTRNTCGDPRAASGGRARPSENASPEPSSTARGPSTGRRR
jgi:hypothetical protein